MSDSKYEDYRMNVIRGIGIEIYLMEKLRTFRQLKLDNPNDETIDDAFDTFMSCFRDVQCGGAKGRKRVINYMWTMRQYVYRIREGHEDQNLPLEESRWPDGWGSVNCVPYGVPDRVGYRGPNDRRERDSIVEDESFEGSKIESQASPKRSEQKGVKGEGKSKSKEVGKQKNPGEKGSRAQSSGPYTKGKPRTKDEGETYEDGDASGGKAKGKRKPSLCGS